ncbi:VirB4-like conjugal transfer ATPase, CD1110 family [Lactococcus lactis]|uniref:VirB4-like conjugal transfer ATPase, CD1110 family n=1 Tax=Lactococcus lactis TaxID=1358 RepID=UPI0018C4E96A|nr:DUF87 domain-containing protein [Lactococcus lactis]MBG1279312.1 DUF87 domain-containing protein [Lactococcus lactis subsp. lactis]
MAQKLTMKKRKKQKMLAQEVGEKPKVEKTKQKKKLSPTTQNTLRYLDLEKGGAMHVTEQEYSKTYNLGTTNYVTSAHDDKINIFTAYFDAINSLSQTEHFQLSMLFNKVSKEEYVRENHFTLAGDQGDAVRQELNDLIASKYDDGKNNYRIGRYISLSTKQSERRRAMARLESAQGAFNTELDTIGVSMHELDGLERMQLMSSILRPGKTLPKSYPSSKSQTQDWIAPQMMDFDQAFVHLDGTIGQVLYVEDFPYELSDTFLKDICEMGVEGAFTIHASPYTFAESKKKVENQKTNVGMALLPQQKRASSEGYSQEFVSPGLKEAWEDLDEQSQYMRKTGSKQFESSLILYVYASSREELIDSLDKVNEVKEKHSIHFEPLRYLQEEGLISTLPLGKNYLEGIKNFTRGLITPNIAINIPWTSVELQHKRGKYFGINLLSKNIISIDRRGRTLQNSNGWIVGTSGSGKSVTCKFCILTDYYQNPEDEFIILDPEVEYVGIGKKVNAQIVKVAPKSKTNINVLDLPEHVDEMDEDDDPVAIKSDLLSAMFSNLLRNGLSEIQESIVDEITTETFEKVQNPTLTDWYGVLGDRVQTAQASNHPQTEKEAEAANLWSKLALYVTGSYDIFAHKTNVDLNNRMVIYDVKQLIKGKMKKFGYMAIIDQIQNRVIDARRRGVKIWVYADEVQTVVAPSSPPILREMFADMWARLRKYGATVTGISQNISLILSTPEGESMFFNSEYFVILRQKGKALNTIIERFELTKQLQQYLKKDEKGAGLVIAGDTIVPFNNPIPKNTLLFDLVNTDAKKKKAS